MLILLVALAMPSASVQSEIKEKVGRGLADPYSAQYDWQPVRDETLYCGWVNAKNRFGAYTGYQPFMALYTVNAKTGKATVESINMETYVVSPMCLGKGYRLTR